MTGKNRIINPRALHDEDVNKMSIHAKFTWAYLPCFADREGRIEDRPFSLKIEIFPVDNIDMESILNELNSNNLIIRYEVKSKKYIQIRNFLKYQRPYSKEPESEIPPPQGFESPEDVIRTLCPLNLKPSSLNLKPSSLNLETSNLNLELSEEEKELLNTPFDTKSWEVVKEMWSIIGLWSGDSSLENLSVAKGPFFREITSSNWHEFLVGLNRSVNYYKDRKNERKYLGTLINFIKNKKWQDNPAQFHIKTKSQPEVDLCQ